MVGQRLLLSGAPSANGAAKRAAIRRRVTFGGIPYRDEDEARGHGAGDEESRVGFLRATSPARSPRPANGDHALPRSRLGNRDAASTRLVEHHRQSVKRKILEGMRHFSLEACRKSDDQLHAIRVSKSKNAKALYRFYEDQNARLDDWLDIDTLVLALADDVIDSMDPDGDGDGVAERRGPLQLSHGAVDGFLPADHLARRERDARRADWAIFINVVANVLMLIGKVVALNFSPSLSLVASTADSALDLFCTLIIYATNRIVAWRLESLRVKFPIGRRRLEPIGILVFSVVMVVSFLQILQESVEKLLPGGDREVAALPPVAIAAMVANAVVKGAIGLLCLRIKTTQVQALVQDCKTDVYFNVVSLLFPLVGVAASAWWLDPLGASLLSLFIIYEWTDTCVQNISRLTGSSVSDRMQQKLMYLAWRFSPVPELVGYKTLTAYHLGDGLWVELDLLLDEKTPLAVAHDIAETLQYCYEGLEEVDRAFVTIDYTALGPLGHAEEC